MDNSSSKQRREHGFTLLEMILTLAILSIMVGAAVPLTRNKIKHAREEELRHNLREIRIAIDRFRQECNQFSPLETDRFERIQGPVPLCYPTKLEYLVEGMKTQGLGDVTLRYLRRIPRDPMTNSTEWGMHSLNDDPNSDGWDGKHVFDVFTKSTETALNGTKYREW